MLCYSRYGGDYLKPCALCVILHLHQCIVICAVSAAAGAKAAAVFANYASVKLLNIIIGIVFLILCASLIVAEYII